MFLLQLFSLTAEEGLPVAKMFCFLYCCYVICLTSLSIQHRNIVMSPYNVIINEIQLIKMNFDLEAMTALSLLAHLSHFVYLSQFEVLHINCTLGYEITLAVVLPAW